MELPPITQVKVLPRIPSLLDRLGVQALPAGAHTRDPIPLRLADEVLRLWPQMKGGGCRSAACRRTSFLYGDLWNHDRISAATHDRLPFIVGRTAVRPFRQLTRIGQHGFVVDHLGRDRYRPGLSRLDLPITFLWSEQSGVFGPGATRRTHDALVERFGQNAYRWQALPGYGHLDSLVGDTAHEDVYPHILEHLNRWVVAPKRMQIA
jgi:cholesterol oxidase